MPLSHVCYSTRAIFPSPSNARQQEVLRLSARGKTHWEIAKALDLSPFTVRIHVSSLLHSLKLPSRAAAAVKYSGAL
jgi:DNA-binding NarL/FixJ family response regulator